MSDIHCLDPAPPAPLPPLPPASYPHLRSVRLPKNSETSHGVVLGEGKPENQNAAMIFCFGEVVQVRGGGGGAADCMYGATYVAVHGGICVIQLQAEQLLYPAALSLRTALPCGTQAIDMNQDNYLAEAMKMRNLINEFNPPTYSDLTASAAASPRPPAAS